MEETNREAEHSEVINTINLLDFTLKYNMNPRWSISVGIPYLMAERSSPIRDENRVTIGRSVSQAQAMGDIIVGAQRWMLNPDKHPGGNFRLGLGLKFPTGPPNVTDTRTRYENGVFVNTIQSVDQSIQPGDGGFGATLDVEWFQQVAKGRVAFYLSGTYLFNPEGTNGVLTYRSRPEEAVMSVSDQYLARLGASFAVPKWKGVALSLGGRVEGVPAYDVFGPSNGFRRPGYAVSVEPAFSLSRGPHVFSLAVPIALYRNRVKSVPDRMTGRHGDAAFADYLVIFGYSRRFGAPLPRPGGKTASSGAGQTSSSCGE